MKQILLALALSAIQPCTSLLAKDGYIYLVAPLETARPSVTTGYVSGPYLPIDDRKTSQTLIEAVDALGDSERTTRDDAVLAISALKTASEDQAWQDYLEKQTGVGMEQVRAWSKNNIKRRVDQRAFQYVDDKTSAIKRKAIGLGTMGLGAGVGLLALPMAFTVVGILPAIALLDVSSSITTAGAKIFANEIPSSVPDQEMPDLMVAMLGEAQAQPGQRIDWMRAPYEPTHELIRRVWHATLLQKSIAAFGTTELQKLSNGDEKSLKVAQELYARDVVLGAMLLSVLSRELDEGRHVELLANIVAKLESDHLPTLALMAGTLASSGQKLQGTPTASRPEAREGRQKEILHFARWTQAAIALRAQDTSDMARNELQRRVEAALGEDANYQSFVNERAEKTVESLRTGLVVAREGKLKERWNKLIKEFREKDSAD